jgi:DNA-binding transcriptional LysR family regulator
VDLALLRTFLAVYRAGSFTAAAPAIGLSQPTVTAQVRALEERLGRRLFERKPRGVTPTSVADELAAAVATHLDALATIADRGIAGADPFTRPLHLAGPAELMAARILPALAGLVGDGLVLRVTLGLADDLLAGLLGGRFDLVVSTIRPRGSAIVADPLADEEFLLLAAPTLADRIDRDLLRTDPAAALRALPLVSYAEDLPIIRRYWRTVFGTRPRAAAAVVVPDLRAVLATTVAGAGVTVLPRYLCARELAEGGVVCLLEPDLPPINTFYLAARAGTVAQPHIAAVRERLRGEARQW